MAAQPRIRFCRCGSSSSPAPVDGGRLICPDCGDPVPDPMILLIARQQRQILERLDQLERGRGDPPEDGRTEDDGGRELIDPAELARRLGRSRDWIYGNADRLGAIRVGDGDRPRIFFDPERVRERLGSLASANGSKPDKPKRKPPRQRCAGVDLLPIKGRST